jgi:polyisoprenoid-binding protein YceI
MNVRFTVAAVAALIAVPAAAQETYVIDPTHSQPQWAAGHIGFSIGIVFVMEGSGGIARSAASGSWIGGTSM